VRAWPPRVLNLKEEYGVADFQLDHLNMPARDPGDNCLEIYCKSDT